MNRTFHIVALFAGAALAAACAHHTQRAPVLNAPPAAATSATPPVPEQKGFFSRTADATWNVVSAPVRLVTPQKSAPAKEPETYEAPDTIIMTPAPDDAPAATQPQ